MAGRLGEQFWLASFWEYTHRRCGQFCLCRPHARACDSWVYAPRDFALDVYAGLFVGWLHKPIPTIARKRVGRGTLLISTFRLARNLETNPLAMYLFGELMTLISADLRS